MIKICLKKIALPILMLSLFSFQIFLPGCVCYQQGEINRYDTIEEALPSTTVSDGNYKSRILISWAPVNHAEKYQIMRSDDNGTTYDTIYSANSQDIGYLLATGPVPDDDPDKPDEPVIKIIPGEFTSDVDLTNGVWFAGDLGTGLSTMEIGITIAGIEAGTASFSGGTLGHRFKTDEVLSIIQDAVRANDPDYLTHFQAVTGGQYIKIVADKEIVLTNKKSLLTASPLATFIKKNHPKADPLVITYTTEEVPGDGDDSGNGDTDTEEDYQIKSDKFYLLDVNITNGTKYQYKVVSYTAKGNTIIETRSDEGFATSSTAPAEVTGLNVSKGEATITLTWNPVSAATSYRVYKYKANRIDQTETFSIASDSLTVTTFSEDSAAIVPGIYFYKVAAFNGSGEEGEHSVLEYGYRSITDEEYMIEHHKEVMLSQQKFSKMHQDGLGAIGTETIQGNISGTGYFSANGGLSGAVANVTYTAYCDSYLNLNGKTTQNITDVWGKNGTMTGTETTGQSTADGKTYLSYKGSVEYHLDIKGAKAGGGYYLVTQEGKSTPTRIEWTFIRDWDDDHPEYQP